MFEVVVEPDKFDLDIFVRKELRKYRFLLISYSRAAYIGLEIHARS